MRSTRPLSILAHVIGGLVLSMVVAGCGATQPEGGSGVGSETNGTETTEVATAPVLGAANPFDVTDEDLAVMPVDTASPNEPGVGEGTVANPGEGEATIPGERASDSMMPGGEEQVAMMPDVDETELRPTHAPDGSPYCD